MIGKSPKFVEVVDVGRRIELVEHDDGTFWLKVNGSYIPTPFATIESARYCGRNLPPDFDPRAVKPAAGLQFAEASEPPAR